MKIVKVDAISSTNSFIKEYVKTNSIKNMFCVVTNHQIEGRGQRGAVWNSDPGKNLTFSVFLPNLGFLYKETFKLSALVALCIKNVLEVYDIPKLTIKWPNDILSRQLKIGGILIENLITKNDNGASIVGVGLNVNQIEFANLPKAASLKFVTGKTYDLDRLLNDILIQFEDIPTKFNQLSYKETLSLYYMSLFRYNKVGMFQFQNKKLAQGLIRGVDNYGKLIVEFEEDNLQSFDVKEIQIKY